MQLFAEAETKMMAEAARKESEDVSHKRAKYRLQCTADICRYWLYGLYTDCTRVIVISILWFAPADGSS
jgi:hypothetical protein